MEFIKFPSPRPVFENNNYYGYAPPKPPRTFAYSLFQRQFKNRCRFNNFGIIEILPVVDEETFEAVKVRKFVDAEFPGFKGLKPCLPLIGGHYQDLKSISPTTLVHLMMGKYRRTVGSYQIIDCRFPYEFDGGHVKGAINIYEKDMCLELLKEENIAPRHSKKRNILIFYCEFAGKRATGLCRVLKKADRFENTETYPYLKYPEIYLLDGGYKTFYKKFPGFCDPVAYKPMLHPHHTEELRYFNNKWKSSGLLKPFEVPLRKHSRRLELL